MDKLNKVLSSFGEQKELEPKIWSNQETLDKKVRAKLLTIAEEFIDFLDVDIVVSDIVMMGSLVNYNWSNYSDVDLHIIVDYKQFDKEQLPLYEKLFKLKKVIFNDRYDIKIYGYEVELYVQDENAAHFSSGVYSILNDEWVSKPKKENKKLDKKLIASKSKQWMNLIDETLKHASEESFEEAKKLVKKIKDKVKKYRTCGLEKGGEYSDENLVFKVLRRSGHIEKLFNFNTKNVDKKLSLKEQGLEDIDIEKIKKDISPIKDKLSNIFKELRSKFTKFKEKDTEEIKSTLKDVSEGKNKFLQDFYKVAKSGKEFVNVKKPRESIPFDESVEKIQTGLQFLGFLLPIYGIDGKFGPETENAVNEFQEKYDLEKTGKMGEDDLLKMFSLLTLENFDVTDLGKIKKEKDFSKGKIKVSSGFDSDQKRMITYLIEEMENYGITNPYAQIGILSVISIESGFKAFKEFGYCGSSDSRIIEIFGSRRGSNCASLKCSNSEFFDCVYGKKSGMSLGNDEPGDGWKYVGRGLNGITGKANYKKFGSIVGEDLVNNPELLEKPNIAAKVAIAYFTKGKPASSLPDFESKESAAKYFETLNVGSFSSKHNEMAIDATKKFDVDIEVV